MKFIIHKHYSQAFREYLSAMAVLFLFLSGISCKKILEVEPVTLVDQSRAYQNVFDADAAVIGIYGKVMGLAKQYVIWNELKGDLLDITFNSDKYLRQISEHTVSADNPYTNPQSFYEVIINCNDVLKNFTIMLQESKLKVDEYNQRYSDIGAIRSWLYLQLGIHFGNIPYVTDPLATVADLKDASKFPMLPFSQLIDSLVSFTEKLPHLTNYFTGTVLPTTVDGNSSSKFFINKYLLLGDLYLWQGQYDKAAASYKSLMEINPNDGSTNWYNQYKISNNASNPPANSINYSRAQDFSSLNYGPASWRNLFERPATDPEYSWEWIWVLPFDRNFAPTNPFIDLFSPIGGSYLVRPSQQAMDYWNSQTQVFTITSGTTTASPVFRDNFPFDSRGVFTYKFINGQPVVMKYLYNYLSAGSANATNLPIDPLSRTGKWFLKRAATLHLHYAEAANRAGKYKLAYALVQNGIPFHFDPIPGGNNQRDATNFQQTFLPFPYDFDARSLELPRYRSSWYRNMGIRGRAQLKMVSIPASDSLISIENLIIHESALELAYEGERWPDLLRIALRRNDPSFLADKVYDKLRKSGLSAGAANAARTKLLSKDWFFPFKW